MWKLTIAGDYSGLERLRGDEASGGEQIERVGVFAANPQNAMVGEQLGRQDGDARAVRERVEAVGQLQER